jgi:hypothetical protein
MVDVRGYLYMRKMLAASLSDEIAAEQNTTSNP